MLATIILWRMKLLTRLMDIIGDNNNRADSRDRDGADKVHRVEEATLMSCSMKNVEIVEVQLRY